jgi:hypothetical protein
MAKSTKKTTDNLLTMPKAAATSRATTPTSSDIAARAFALYCERGGQDGHDVEDWLQAEREISQAKKKSTAA